MKGNIVKMAAAAILFLAWAAIVFAGKTTMPGAETLIAWIQGALAALVGVHMYRVGADSGAAPEETKPDARETKPENTNAAS